MNADQAPQALPYADLIVNLKHCLTTITAETDMWYKVIYATELFEGICNTPRQPAFLLEPAEGEEIFLRISQLMDTLEKVPMAQADKYYRVAIDDIESFMKLGQMAINIRLNPDTAESKYNQTILVQYQSLLGRTPQRLPYDGLGSLLKSPRFNAQEEL